MTAEQTLANRRGAPDPGNDTRLVAYDITSGESSAVAAGPGVKINPSVVNGTVAYVRKDTGDGGAAGIYYANGTRGPKGDVRAAAWSPDGMRVVFHRRITSPRPTWRRIWSRNPTYELTLTANLPSFSPSGERFATLARIEGILGTGLAVAATGADTNTVIYQDKTRNVLAPQWSPLGRHDRLRHRRVQRVLQRLQRPLPEARRSRESGAQIAMIHPDGSGFRELTSGANNNSFPSMAPDGRRLVYRSFGPEGDGLRIKDLETGAVTPLTSGYDNFPIWSPRGDLILFSRQADGDYEIYTVRPDGTGVKRLTTARGNDAHQAWSPDGEHIAFATSRMGFKDEMTYTDAPQPYGEIFVMRYDGTELQQLTDNQWEEGTPAWQPVRRPPSDR